MKDGKILGLTKKEKLEFLSGASSWFSVPFIVYFIILQVVES